METLFHSAPFTGYVYPNETVFPWTVLIVVYPYLTGLGRRRLHRFEPVSGVRFPAIEAGGAFRAARFPVLHDCCAATAAAASRSSRARVQCHDHAAFDFRVGHLWLCCCFFSHSVDVGDLVRVSAVHRARGPTTRKGRVGWIYRVATLGSYDLSEKAMSYDRKWLFALAIIGIPGAHGLHGYVGFRVRFAQIPRMVVLRSHAGHLSVFRDHLRYRAGDRALCRVVQAAQGSGRPRVPESHGLFAVGFHDVYPAAGRAGICQPGLSGPGGLST